jgi:hypothetical protein
LRRQDAYNKVSPAFTEGQDVRCEVGKTISAVKVMTEFTFRLNYL